MSLCGFCVIIKCFHIYISPNHTKYSYVYTIDLIKFTSSSHSINLHEYDITEVKLIFVWPFQTFFEIIMSRSCDICRVFI